MSKYRTCHNCALASQPCKRRDEVRARIAGLGLTSVKFTCRDRRPLFEAGQRVIVSWPVADPDGGYHDGYTLESWPATVVGEAGARFKIVVDDVASDYETPARSYMKNESLYASVSAVKLAPIDEPARVICSVCEGVRADDGSFPACHGYPGYRPQRCGLAPTRAVREAEGERL